MIITPAQAMAFLLILARLVGLFLTAPFFNDKRISAWFKMTLLVWVASLLIFVVPLSTKAPNTPLLLMITILVEFTIGVIVGFTADLIVVGIRFAGTLMDTQAGISVASLMDPSTGQNAALFEQLLKWISLIVFLAIDGHHMVLSALYQSFFLLPIGSPIDFTEGIRYIMTFGKDIFLIGMQLASPIILVVFLVDFGFGVLNRVAEQINVFNLGFQIKPTVSLFIFLAIIPGLGNALLRIVYQVMDKMLNVLYLLQLKG